MQLQFTLHLHFVFYRNECAQPECGVFFTTSPPHARCLTLTLAPDGAGPGCSRVRESRGQQPFRYPRVRRTRHHARTLLFQSTVVVTPCSGARVRHQCQPLSRNNYLTSRRFAPQLWSASARRRFDLRDMSRSPIKNPRRWQFWVGSYLSLLNVAEGRPLACRARPRNQIVFHIATQFP